MKRVLTLVGALALALSTASVAAAAPPSNQHCPDHKNETKVEIDDDWSGSTTVTVQDQDGNDVDVEVTVHGGEVSFAGDGLEGVDYCLKGGTANTGKQSGLSGNTDAIPNRGGRTPDISYVVIYGAETGETVVVTPCGEGLTASGGIEGFVGAYELGTVSGDISVTYTAFFVPDRFELTYDGVVLLDVASGTDVNQPFYSTVVDAWVADGATIDPSYSNTVQIPYVYNGTSSVVDVEVTGSTDGTAWDLEVSCPVAP